MKILMQVVGTLLIVAGPVGAWVIVRRTKTTARRVAGATSVGMLGILGGGLLLMPERVTSLTFPGLGSINAAVEQATTDAKAIAEVRQRIEAQSATIDLVARDANDAKKLVETLRLQNENAAAEMKQIAQKTAAIDGTVEKIKLDALAIAEVRARVEAQDTSISRLHSSTHAAQGKIDNLEAKTEQLARLPDGRTVAGSMVSGDPTSLIELIKKTRAAAKEQQWPLAFSTAKEALNIYEETKLALRLKRPMMVSGEINPGAISYIYWLAATGAGEEGNYTKGIELIERAAELSPSPDLAFDHVLMLRRAGRKDDAQKLIDDTFKKGGDFAAKFRTLLIDGKIISPWEPFRLPARQSENQPPKSH